MGGGAGGRPRKSKGESGSNPNACSSVPVKQPKTQHHDLGVGMAWQFPKAQDIFSALKQEPTPIHFKIDPNKPSRSIPKAEAEAAADPERRTSFIDRRPELAVPFLSICDWGCLPARGGPRPQKPRAGQTHHLTTPSPTHSTGRSVPAARTRQAPAPSIPAYVAGRRRFD